MRRTLLVTNDFPPRAGGIQSYLYQLVSRMAPDRVVVYASRRHDDPPEHDRFDAEQPFPVVRHPGIMAGQPSVLRGAREVLRAERCDTVWFGAAAPLALLTPALRVAGAQRVLASTHGHEVGWSMLPGGRRALRRIGEDVDVVSYVSRYARSRFASAFGPAAALEYLPSGVDPARYRPDPTARARIRTRYGLGERPVVVCVSRVVPRKGQDMLVRALPRILRQVPNATLLLVGGGRYVQTVRRLAARQGVSGRVVFAGRVAAQELPAHYVAGDVFAMPCRTRGGGLDVEGLGIVYLEASAAGLPVVAGRSGGAPETVVDGVTGHVVNGADAGAVADAVAGLLADPAGAAAMGAAGRAWVTAHWTWEHQVARLRALLAGN